MVELISEFDRKVNNSIENYEHCINIATIVASL